MKLPDVIKPEPAEPAEAALEIRVRAHGRTHGVVVHAFGSVRHRKQARRFAELWRQVMELVPPSNSEQKAEEYRSTAAEAPAIFSQRLSKNAAPTRAVPARQIKSLEPDRRSRHASKI